MNNYYFTESKWYGPLPENGIDFNNDAEAQEYYLSLPSGDSLIPQFAGMVKEEGKEFVFNLTCEFNKPCECDVFSGCKHIRKTAVPVAEEGKQTFSKSDMIGFAEYCADQTDFMRTEDGIWKSFDEQKACNTEYLLTEYLKTKQ